MPTPPLDNEVLIAAAEAFKLKGSKKLAAEHLGVPINTFKARLISATKRGLVGFDPVMAGFEVNRVSSNVGANGEAKEHWVRQTLEPGDEFKVPDGQMVKGVSALVDQDGRVKQQWIKTKQGEVDPAKIAEWLKGAFLDVEPAEKRQMVLPDPSSSDLLTLIPCNDWHINMLAWERETGTNWDLKIAERAIGSAIHSAVMRAPESGTAIVLGGGDLLHADNKDARTAHAGNALDVDGRYQKGVETALRLMVRTVEAALDRHDRVIVRILPGNHDEHTSVAIAYYLHAYYRAEPRVEVDLDASLFFWHRFGDVMIGATHGHTVKLRDMPMIMAARRSADWGNTKFRYVHGFHIHHKEMHGWEEQGVVAEAHQAPIPQDAWHYASGFLSGRSVQTISYHARFGEIGRARMAILDA